MFFSAKDRKLMKARHVSFLIPWASLIISTVIIPKLESVKENIFQT